MAKLEKSILRIERNSAYIMNNVNGSLDVINVDDFSTPRLNMAETMKVFLFYWEPF